MKGKSVFILTFFLAVVVFSAIAMGVSKQPSDTVNTLPEFNDLKEFSLEFIDQRQQVQSIADFEGSVWVTGLIFTRCAGQCPEMMRQLKQLDDLLIDKENVSLVPVSVDPDHDTPEVLERYAEKFNATGAHWKFLTGSAENMERLAREGLLLGSSEAGSEEEFIFHSRKLVLIDQRLNVRGYYDAFEAEDMSALAQDLQQLLRVGR